MPNTTLQARVEDIRERMRAAGDRGQVTLLAAVKYATAEQINELHRECGVCDVGENRVQQLLEHYEGLEDKQNLNIHFIGSLQKNKVKYIVDKVCMIHSLDSLPLAEEIEKRCAAIGRVMDVLVEINSGREESKGGILPDEVESFCRKLSDFPHLRLRGFMTMAPKCENSAEYRKYFGENLSLMNYLSVRVLQRVQLLKHGVKNPRNSVLHTEQHVLKFLRLSIDAAKHMLEFFCVLVQHRDGLLDSLPK